MVLFRKQQSAARFNYGVPPYNNQSAKICVGLMFD